MSRYGDRYNSTTRLYVGNLSSRTRSRDLDHIFSRYGRVRDVDMKREFAFVDFSDSRDADDARHYLDGKNVDGRRITVEFAKGVPRGRGGVREYVGRGPPPGSGRCFNCGIEGHWARDCKSGDWKNKCYRCGERGHIERDCKNSPKKLVRGQSYSRSPVRSRSPRRGRGRSYSRSYSRSRSPVSRHRDERRKSWTPETPEKKRGGSSPSNSKRNQSPTPDRESPGERSASPARGKMEMEQDYVDSPRETTRSPAVSPGPGGGDGLYNDDESPSDGANGHNEHDRSHSPAVSPGGGDRNPGGVNDHDRSTSPVDADRSPIVDDDDGDARSPRGSESP